MARRRDHRRPEEERRERIRHLRFMARVGPRLQGWFPARLEDFGLERVPDEALRAAALERLGGDPYAGRVVELLDQAALEQAEANVGDR